jgi:methylated-DNA-[protein]-cysteine S-methyltransferase
MTLPTTLDERFRARAATDGLLDVAYDYVDSPVGPLLVAATERGLCRISFDPVAEDELDELAHRHGTRVLRSAKPLVPAHRQLDAYFEGRRTTFDVAVDTEWLPRFQQDVLAELARVPFGRTATYGGLAALIGRPRAARAVGGALNRNPLPIVLPCHRVVGVSGRLVGYAGGLERKRALLAHEGVVLS